MSSHFMVRLFLITFPWLSVLALNKKYVLFSDCSDIVQVRMTT